MSDPPYPRESRRHLEQSFDPPEVARRDEQTDPAGGNAPPASRWTLPEALRGAEYDRVRETWKAARLQRDHQLPEFIRALEAHARHARDVGIGVADVLQSLDTVIRADRGGEPALDWDHMREIAGRTVIRAYYRDD